MLLNVPFVRKLHSCRYLPLNKLSLHFHSLDVQFYAKAFIAFGRSQVMKFRSLLLCFHCNNMQFAGSMLSSLTVILAQPYSCVAQVLLQQWRQSWQFMRWMNILVMRADNFIVFWEWKANSEKACFTIFHNKMRIHFSNYHHKMNVHRRRPASDRIRFIYTKWIWIISLKIEWTNKMKRPKVTWKVFW